MEHLIDRLDEQLRQDCHLIARQGDMIVLLHRNALTPWFILVPLHPEHNYRELYELPVPQREQLMQASDLISGYLVRRFKASKLNIAAIGNLVPQFHWHLVGRQESDALWPAPVWGNLGEQFKAWQEDDLQVICNEVERLIEILPGGDAGDE